MLDLKEISYQPQTGERKIIDNLNLKVLTNESAIRSQLAFEEE